MYITKITTVGQKPPPATMNRPAPVELCHKNMRFLITHNPTDGTLSSFIEVRNINASSQNLHKWPCVSPLYQAGFHVAFFFFSQDLKRYGATTVVRVCDITYDKAPLENDGINVVVRKPQNTHQRHLHHSGTGIVQLQIFQDWPFDDGAPPPSKLVDDWLSLLKKKFQEDPGCCVAVHCVAGLGRCESSLREEYAVTCMYRLSWHKMCVYSCRAPVLVALALIESGMKYEDAIQLIRQ